MKTRTLIGLVLLGLALAAEGKLLALGLQPSLEVEDRELPVRPSLDVVFKEGDEYVAYAGPDLRPGFFDASEYRRWRDRGCPSPWEGARDVGRIYFEPDAFAAWEADGYPVRAAGDRVIVEDEQRIWVRAGNLSPEEEWDLRYEWSVSSEGRGTSPRLEDVWVVDGGVGPVGRSRDAWSSGPVGKRITVGDPGNYTIEIPRVEGYATVPPLEVALAEATHRVIEVQLERTP